jgi:hypothetical protein
MTDQTTTTDPARGSAAARRTRRQLLAGGTGALAAVLTAETLARPTPAYAGTDGDVVLGQANTETSGTGITNTTFGSPVLLCTATGSGDAIIAQSPDGVAVDGSSTTGFGGAFSSGGVGVSGIGGGSGPGVRGLCITGEGVYGQNGRTGSALTGVNNGVHGVSNSATGNGVLGENSGGGAGVAGASGTGVAVFGSSPNGTGVWGTSANGTGVKATGQIALAVAGPAVFDRSGTLTISAGKASATQTGIAPLTAASLVLATVQQNLSGVYVRAAVPNVAGNSFTVYLSKAPSVSAKVAWFVVN